MQKDVSRLLFQAYKGGKAIRKIHQLELVLGKNSIVDDYPLELFFFIAAWYFERCAPYHFPVKIFFKYCVPICLIFWFVSFIKKVAVQNS